MARFKKVQKGDKLQVPADTWNALMDMASRSQTQGTAFGRPPVRANHDKRDNTYVLVKNASSEDQERFAIMGIEDVVIKDYDNQQEFKNNYALSVIKPVVPSHFGRWVVLQEPIAAGKFGHALLTGTTVVKMNGSGKACAEIIDGDSTALVNMSSGSARVLYSGSEYSLVSISEDIATPWRFKMGVTGFNSLTRSGIGDIIEPDGTDTGGDDTINDPLNIFLGQAGGEGWALRIADTYYAIGGNLHGGFIRVRNDTGKKIERYEVLGIDGVVTTPQQDEDAFLNAAVFKGVIPVECDHEGKYVIAQEDIEEDTIGACMVSGATQCKVLVQQPTHKYADIADGKVEWLESRRYGSSRILFLDGTSNDEWAIVRLSNHGQSIWKAKLFSDIGEDGVALADIYELDGTNTGKQRLVNDTLGCYSEYVADDWVTVVYDPEDCEYYVIDACCKV